MFTFGVAHAVFSAAVAMRIERIAGQHGAVFVSEEFPDGPRSWFIGPNFGPPFNALLARYVLAALATAGIAYPVTRDLDGP